MSKKKYLAPKVVLEKTMATYEMDMLALARGTNLTVKVINAILQGKQKINESIARQLETIFTMPATSWLKLERDYQKYLKRKKKQAKKDKDIAPCPDGKHSWEIQPEGDIHDAVCIDCGICASELNIKEKK